MTQIHGGDTVDVGQPPVGIPVEIQAGHRIEQASVGAVGDRNRQGFLIEGIDLALKDLKSWGIDDLKVMKVRYFEFVSEATLAKVFPNGFPGWPLEHAGVMTTSVLLHLRPNLIHMERVPDQKPVIYPPYDLFPADPSQGTQTGILATAKSASPEKGKLLFDEFVEGISNAVREAFALCA